SRNFIASTGLPPLLLPIILTSRVDVTACCACMRAGSRRFPPNRFRREAKGGRTFVVWSATCRRVGSFGSAACPARSLEAAEFTSFFLEGPAFGPGEEKDAFGRGD